MARITYFEVIEYLEKDWTLKEINNFINEVEEVLKRISANPYMFQASRRKNNIRRGFITRHNSLYYRIRPRKKEIELITFWNNSKSPKKLSY